MSVFRLFREFQKIEQIPLYVCKYTAFQICSQIVGVTFFQKQNISFDMIFIKYQNKEESMLETEKNDFLADNVYKMECL